MTVLVIGARSKIGNALLDRLTERGEKVLAFSRTGEPTRRDGVEQVSGDLADKASVETAMSGVDAVFLLSSPDENDIIWHRNAIDAARRAGVGRLVRSSLLGADPESECAFRRHHGEIDAYLAASGVPFTVLRPNYFLQNIPDQIVASIDDDGVFHGSAGDARLSMVDTRDIAAAAARVLTEDGHLGAYYALTGGQALSQHDVAESLTTHLGRPVRYTDVPLEATRQSLAGFGLDPWLVNAVVELYADYQRSGPHGYAAQVGDDLPTLLGRAPHTLDDLLAEHPAGARHLSPRKRVVLRVYQELFTEGRLEVADELLAEDYVNHATAPGVPPTRDGVKQIVRAMREAFPDFASRVESMVEEADLVAVRGYFTGTQQRAWAGRPATGEHTRIDVVDFFRFNPDDRIVERWA